MILKSLILDKEIVFDLNFFKPFKSKAIVQFNLKALDNGYTEVNWIMDTQMPFFLFFMIKSMKAYIGRDFVRGLEMLKDLCEAGAVVSNTVNQGIKHIDGYILVGIKSKCLMADLASAMSRDYNLLQSYSQKNQIEHVIGAVSLVDDFNIVSGFATYTAGFVVSKKMTSPLPEGCQYFDVPAHKALVIDYYGPYKHLGNPWGQAMTIIKGDKYKMNKSVVMYEKYITMPDGVDESKTHTQVVVPLK